jgi:hypothetical protein
MPALALCALALTGCGGPPPCRLCDAVEARDAAGVRAMLTAGESVSVRALQIATDPTLVAVRTQGGDEGRDRAIAELLLEKGDPNAHWTTAGGRLRGSSSSGSQETVYVAEALMESWGDRAMVDRLLARGLDVRGTPGGQALRQAVISRRHDAAEALLAAGAPVNHVGVNVLDQTTPLAEAIQTRDLALIGLLEAAGAVEWVD